MRYTDLDEAARQLLLDLAKGGDGTAVSLMMGHALIKSRLTRLAEQIWTQGWDCREEQGPLAGAFGHANRHNPYRISPEPRKCRSCGAQPLYTERGRCEDCGDCQGCGDDECPQCYLQPRYTFEVPARTVPVADAWDAGYEAGILAQTQKARGKAKFKIYNPYRER